MTPVRAGTPQALLLCALALLANLLAAGPGLRSVVTPGSDFLSFYAGARLAGTPALYDPAAAAEIQRSVGWSSSRLAFIRPPFYAWALKPFGWMEYERAFLVWQALNALAFVLAVALAPVAWQIRVPVGLACYPAVLALMNSQDSLLVLLVVTLVWRLAARPATAGWIQAAAAIKYHLFVAMPVYAAIRREWRFAASACAGIAGLAAASYWLQGNWIPDYRAALANPNVHPGLFLMPTLHGLLHQAPGWVELAASAAAVVCCGFAVRHPSRSIAYGAALLAGLLLSRHAYPQDAVLLFPLVCAGIAEGRTVWLRRGCLFAACPLVYVAAYFPPWSLIPQLFLVGLLVVCGVDSREGAAVRG